jgi:hypothetical protein
MKWFKTSTVKTWIVAAAVGISLTAGTATAQDKELRVGYQPNPIQDASIAMMEKWGAKNGVKITKIPNSYGVYVEKMTASLTSNSDQYDIIWHNDDWGQLWAHLLEPTDDVEGLKYADKWGMDGIIFNNAQGQNTVVPMGQRERIAQDMGRSGENQQKTSGRRQGEVRLCRRHGHEPYLVYLVLVDVEQQLRRAVAGLRASQCEAGRQQLEIGARGTVHAPSRRVLVGRHQYPQDQSARHAGL